MEVNKEYKLINLLAYSNIIPHINENSSLFKVLYNFIPNLHLSMLNEAIDLLFNDTSERIVPLIIISELIDLKDLEQSKIRIVEIELNLESLKDVQK